MKLTITRNELKAMIFKEFGHDIDVDIEIEGYIQQPNKNKDAIERELENIRKNSIYGIGPDLPRRTTTIDKNGFVTDIKDEAPAQKSKAEIKNKLRGNLNNHPDYTDYENTILDFATSSEHKRQVPFFGAGTIECCKARYQKMIDKLNVKDSVKFSRLNSLPYLVKIEGEKSMGDILNEGINK